MAEGPKQTVNHIFFLYIVTFNLFFRQLTLMLGAYLCMCVCVCQCMCVCYSLLSFHCRSTQAWEKIIRSQVLLFGFIVLPSRLEYMLLCSQCKSVLTSLPRTGFLRAMFIIEAVLMRDFFHHPSLYSSLPSILLSTHPPLPYFL